MVVNYSMLLAFLLRMESSFITRDGYVVSVGEDEVLHPVYNIPSYEMTVHLTLSPEELLLYRHISSSGEGVIRMHIRSSLAQLGVDAFHPSTSIVNIEGAILSISTLIVSFNGLIGQNVIGCIRGLSKNQIKPCVMHLGLFPHKTRVKSAHAVQDLIDKKLLRIDGADMYQDGSIGLVPIAPLYTYDSELCTENAISHILFGNGRKNLISLRKEDALGDTLDPGVFLVCGVAIDTTQNHVVLRREVKTNTCQMTDVVHGESCILQAGRTRGGSRQLELWNRGNAPINIRSLRIIADMYRADDSILPGD